MKTPQFSTLLWMILLGGLIIPALLSSQLARFDPLYAEPLKQFAPPSSGHWLGLDQLGRDVFSRLVWGARHSLSDAALATGMAIIAGLAVGGAAGVLGGWPERLLMRGVDVLLAFPGLLLALVSIAALGSGRWQAALAVGLSLAPTYSRLVRAAMLSIREETYIEAIYALGASRWRVLWRHLIPNAMRQIAAMGTVMYAWALTNGAALDFLGLTGSPSEPSWGRMISEGRAFLGSAPWIAAAPGVMLTVSVLCIMGLGDSLHFQETPTFGGVALHSSTGVDGAAGCQP